MNLADDHDLDGDKQCALGKIFSLSGESYLFEFYSREDAEAIVNRINTLGLDEALRLAMESREKKDNGTALELAHNDEIVGTEVIDEDGEVVTITQELREAFLMDHGKVEGAFWQIAFALAKIRNMKSYLAAGFTGFEDYASKALPLGLRQAYGYALVGDSFKEYEDKLLHSSAGNYGITKAKLIASQGEKEVRRLMKKGKIKFGEKMLSEEELENSTVKDLRALLKLAEQDAEKYKEKAGKAELLEEKLKNAELEMQDLQEFYKENKDDATQNDEIQALLEKASNHLVWLRRELLPVNTNRRYEEGRETPRDKDIAHSIWFITQSMIDTAYAVRYNNEIALELHTAEISGAKKQSTEFTEEGYDLD